MFGTVENNTHNFPIMTIGEFANCFAGATPSTSHPEYWENGRIPETNNMQKVLQLPNFIEACKDYYKGRAF